MTAPTITTNSRAENEAARRWIHLGCGLGAFSLVFLDWRVVSLLFFLAFLINSEVVPRAQFSAQLLRSSETGLRNGISAYPLVLFILSLIFQDRLMIVAVAWATMAFGDASAAYVGNTIGGKTWPWNADKTLTGSMAFALASVGGIAIVLWQFETLGLLSLIAAIFIAALGALVETLKWPFSDNYPVAFTTALGAMLAELSGLWVPIS